LIQAKDNTCNTEKDELEAEKLLQNQNLEILSWLSLINIAQYHQDFMEVRKLNTTYADSGQWLFDRIEKENFLWNEDHRSAALWLYGDGKIPKFDLHMLQS
jgi:hypothetical protein